MLVSTWGTWCRHAAAQLWPVARDILSPWDSRSMFATRVAAGFENSFSNASISSLSFYGSLCAAQQPNREHLVLYIPLAALKDPMKDQWSLHPRMQGRHFDISAGVGHFRVFWTEGGLVVTFTVCSRTRDSVRPEDLSPF